MRLCISEKTTPELEGLDGGRGGGRGGASIYTMGTFVSYRSSFHLNRNSSYKCVSGKIWRVLNVTCRT